MRQLSPAFIVTSLALAIASGNAFAQASGAGTTNGLSGASVTSPAPSAIASSNSSSTGGSGIGAMGTNSTNEVLNPTAGVATNASGIASGIVVPGAVISVDAGVNANGERVATDNRAAAAVNGTPAVTPTPLFELTARQGAAKQAARRARGEEPRVYGIAPRTDRDLTNQMPDDPIIRY